MLKLNVQGDELYDEIANEFYNVKPTTLSLEHSLISVAKWEAKWHKPYLDKKPKTVEERLDYVRCMSLTQSVDPNVFRALDKKDMEQIDAYIEDPYTATTFSNSDGSSNLGANKNKIITAEELYYFMFKLGIPIECAKWHLNRLLVLIEVFNAYDGEQKELTPEEARERVRRINAKRRK